MTLFRECRIIDPDAQVYSGLKNGIVFFFSALKAYSDPCTGVSNHGYRKPLCVCLSETLMIHNKQPQVIMSMENEECNITAIFIYNINYSIKQKKKTHSTSLICCRR